MADESINLTQDESTIDFNLFWYNAHHDLQISEKINGELVARMLFVPPPEALRAIADQFYEWADMLDQHYTDSMEQAIIEKNDELIYKLKQHDKHENLSWRKSKKRK